MSKQKINITIGRFQPFTQGHLNMINEGKDPCIIYRINSSDKQIYITKTGIKIGSKKYTKNTVKKIIEYINNPIGELNKQEKELLKRPFTNELINKEFEIVKKSNKNIIDVIPVVNVYDALGKYNQFLTEHSDEYEVGDWMCGDDRKDNYEKNIEGLSKYTELETELKSGKTYPNILIGKLKVNTGKGRTAGVSGTAVRKAILNKDKTAFEKIMPKGTGSLFNDFTKAFDDFKAQLQNIIKEHKMISLKKYICESLNKYFSKQEIEKIKKDINAKDGQFIKFVDDKVDKNLGWKAAYNDYLDQCLDDDRCTAEFAAYIEMIIGRHNFSLEQVQKFINTEDLKG